MHIFIGDFNFKGVTARRLYKSFGVKKLIENIIVFRFVKMCQKLRQIFPGCELQILYIFPIIISTLILHTLPKQTNKQV
jgi:hypothetical protein